MNNERQKQNYEAMEPSKKRMLLEKKARDSTNKCQKTQTRKGAFQFVYICQAGYLGLIIRWYAV